MEPMVLEITEEGTTQQSPSLDLLPFARNYQLEALETAIKQNSIVFPETGSGKTFIDVMLLRGHTSLLRMPSLFFAVFLVTTVPLVRQVLVMIRAILLAALRHSCLKIDMIEVLIFDECHNARGKHPYACIMTVLLCKRFQRTIRRVLIDHKYEMLHGILGELCPRGECAVFDCLVLPTTGSHQLPLIDWECISFVQFLSGSKKHLDFSPDRCHGRLLRTLRDSLCSCMLKNYLVVTQHNDELHCISGILHKLDGSSSFPSKNGGLITYKTHFKQCHNITLEALEQPLLRGNLVFPVQNYLPRCKSQNANEPREASVELPPEFCDVVMSPISVALFYSLCFAPSIMHQIESLLLAATLKSMLVDLCMQNDEIATIKVMEAITTKDCQENFNLEPQETLGDSFLKYVVSLQLFKTNQNDYEGSLTIKRKKIVSNVSLSKLGCNKKVLGFIRNESFDLKTWIIPRDNIGAYILEKEFLFSKKILFGSGRRKVIRKNVVVDVVEALIGSFIHSGGEYAALSFMEWLGMKVDFMYHPYTMPLQLNQLKLVIVEFLDSLFNYKFQDTSLPVNTLIDASLKVFEILRIYQILEFLGDALLNYVVTKYLHDEHFELSLGKIVTIEIVANGIIVVNCSHSSSNEEIAYGIASKDVLKMLKESMSSTGTSRWSWI